MEEIKCTIPAPTLDNTVKVLEGYATRLEGAIDVLAGIPAGRKLVEPYTKLLAMVRHLTGFYAGLKEQGERATTAPEPSGKSVDEILDEFKRGLEGLAHE